MFCTYTIIIYFSSDPDAQEVEELHVLPVCNRTGTATTAMVFAHVMTTMAVQ